jgi:hypothetical protein
MFFHDLPMFHNEHRLDFVGSLMTFKWTWRRPIAFVTLLSFVFSYAPLVSAGSGVKAEPFTKSSLNRAVNSEIKIAGRRYKLIEQKNSRGQVTRQMLMGDGRTEISIDPSGTGKLESWELITPDADITMHDARNGKFIFMDVVQRLKTSQVTMRFSYNWNIRRYEMFSVESHAFKTLFDMQDFALGCRTDDQSKAFDEISKKLDTDLSVASQDKALRTSIENSVMDNTCDAKGWRGAQLYPKDSILDAVMEVAKSDKDFNGDHPQTRGRFLQCLRFYDLGVHASRISAGIAQFMPGPGSHQGNPWSLACAKDKTAEAGEFGSFNQTTHQIKLYETAKDLNGKSSDAQREEYAHVFFHEMIHYSQIEDETVTHSAEDCCSQQDGVDNGSCKKLEGLLQNKFYAQQIELGIARARPDHARFRDNLREHFGPLADPMLDDFYLAAGEIFQKSAEDKNCEPTSWKYAQCKQKFYDDLGKTIYGNFFAGPNGGRCLTQSLLRVSADEAKRFCAELRKNAGDLFHVNIDDKGDVKYNPKGPICPRPGNQASSRTIRTEYAFFQSLIFPAAWAEDAVPDCGFSYDETREQTAGRAYSGIPATGSSSFDPGTAQKNADAVLSGHQPLAPGPHPDSFNVPADADLAKTAKNAGGQPTEGQVDVSSGSELGNGQKKLGSNSTQAADPDSANGSGVIGIRSSPDKQLHDVQRDTGGASTKSANSDSKASPSTGSDNSQTFYSRPSQGPDRPIYSNDSPDRQRALVDHFEQSDTVLNQTRQIADTVSRSILPEAEASEAPHRSTVGQTKSALVNPAELENYTSHLSSLTVPDPLSSSAGHSLVNTRMPSFKNAAADGASMSGSSSNGGSTNSGAASSGAAAPREPGSAVSRTVSSIAGGNSLGSGSSGADGGATVAQLQDKGKLQDETPAKQHARERLFQLLQGSYEKIEPELGRARWVGAMVDHQVQVVDAKGRVHGSGFPKYHFVYDPKLGRLKLQGKP